ncbi:MAG: PDGLE domain-containing protein [Actinobacteria bacterium]|nr:PDGLE domain-containing protein [Actinomycetota bacterium]MCL5071832.1 PDGLE domain-containing protein [Actinomycetota bacterium]
MVKVKLSDKNIIIAAVTIVVISLLLAAFLSPFASNLPDGLEKVAQKFGFAEKATQTINSKFFVIKDYSVSFTDNEFWKGALAGLFGVSIVLAVFGIIFLIYKILQISRSRTRGSR